MSQTVFVCPTPKCAYAIDAEGLNQVKLKVLRRTAKTCPKCGNRAVFQEQTSLPNIQTKTTTTTNGGVHEKADQTPSSAVPKSASQRRAQGRHDGQH